MTNHQVGALLRATIKEPDDKEFNLFKKQYLDKKNEDVVVKRLLFRIGQLESYIHELKEQFGHLEKMPKEDYINLLRELRFDRIKMLHKADCDKLIEEIRRTKNQCKKLLEQKLQLENRLMRLNPDNK